MYLPCTSIFLVLILSLASFNTAQKERRIQVSVYYETLCPDSQRFITEQLYPTWKKLRDYIVIDFVPFGKSSSDSFGNFKCQHGPEECRGNKIQSCVLSQLNPFGPKEEFVYCMMSSHNPNIDARTCASSLGISWTAVQECLKNGSGTALQLQAEQETYNVQHRPISFVPTIVFNHRYNANHQNEALNNFRGIVCKFLGAPLPNGCSNHNRFF